MKQGEELNQISQFPFSEGLTPVSIINGSGYGYIDKKGNMVIKPKWEYAKEFENGVAIVTRKVNNNSK